MNIVVTIISKYVVIKNIFRLRVWGSDENQASLTNCAFSFLGF